MNLRTAFIAVAAVSVSACTTPPTVSQAFDMASKGIHIPHGKLRVKKRGNGVYANLKVRF